MAPQVRRAKVCHLSGQFYTTLAINQRIQYDFQVQRVPLLKYATRVLRPFIKAD